MVWFIPGLLSILMLVSSAGASRVQMPQTGAADEPLLADARRYFNALEYERAVASLDRIVEVLRQRPQSDPAVRQALIAAYEMRGRSRVGLGDQRGAAEDFQALLRLAPEFRLSEQVSPRVVALFEENRTLAVGQVVLKVNPEDAALTLDGSPWRPSGAIVHLGAGPHIVTASRPGYRALSQPFEVMPGGAQDLAVTLERVSASLTLLVSPPGVEVIVDGVSRGKTDPTGEDAATSRPFVVSDLSAGVHTLELKRECHTSLDRRVPMVDLRDYQLDPIRLQPTVGTLQITSGVADATVFVDGVAKGTVPLRLPDVCEGAHVVELRTSYGRAVRRLTLRAGDETVVEALPKPAFAVLSVAGLSGEPDPRAAVERALAGATTVTVFAPAADQSDRLLQAHGLRADWLAVDPPRRPKVEEATLSPHALQEVSRLLAKALEVQGVAAISVVPGADRRRVLLSLLAAGSGEPDVLDLTLDSPESAARVQAHLDATIALSRPSLGLVAMDVLDVSGAVVGKVDSAGAAATAGLLPGDVIVAAHARPIADVAALEATLQSVKPGAQLVLDVRGGGVVPKQVEVTASFVPHALAPTDRSLLFNKVLVELRRRLASGPNSPDEAVIRLNIAIALIRLGNWREAQQELDRVSLPDGPGVSRGTVKYLKGLCFEASGLFAEAETAWSEAAAQSTAVLSEDGPSVSEMAKAKLDQLRRARGR